MKTTHSVAMRLMGAALVLLPAISSAQQSSQPTSPFLFTGLPGGTQSGVVAMLDAGFNERAFEPVAGERWEQRANALVALNSFVSVHGQLGLARSLDGGTNAAQQFELLTTPFKRGAYSFGANVGWRHEYGGTNVGLLRIGGARMTSGLSLAADALLEKPYADNRDEVDVITTFAASHALGSHVWLGVEAVGSDLEGFFEEEEAEGGATLLIGPSLAVGLADRWRLVVGGGPVLRVTNNDPVPGAPIPRRSGYVLRTSLRFGW